MAAKKIITNYNLAGGDTAVTIQMGDLEKYAIQAVWSGLTGTTNGKIKISQSLDKSNFDTLKTINSSGEEVDFDISLNSAAGSASIEDKSGFTGEQMKVSVVVTGITGGTLNVWFKKILN